MLDPTTPHYSVKVTLISAFALLFSACGGAAQHTDTEATSAPSADTPSAQFAHLLASNIEAAKNHFWDVIDCEKRDEETGMPTNTLLLPGATRSFIDSSDYTTQYIFPREGLGESDLHAFVYERIKTSLPTGYAYRAYDDGPGGAVHHTASPDDFVSIEFTVLDDLLYVSFHPATNRDIPWGNPCIKGAPQTP